MRKSIFCLALMSLFFTPYGQAKGLNSVNIPRKIHFNTLPIIADNTLKIEVSTINEDPKTSIKWFMSSGERSIFYTKLKELENALKIYSPLKIPHVSENYKGIKITITDTYGNDIIPITLYDGAVRDERGNLFALDPLRRFEYWIWSTGAPETLNSVYKMLPIIDFKQCTSLGHRIVETKPRQCLVYNGDIFLDVMEAPTQESIQIKNFDDCLVEGQALIQTFPRRCIAAGGHVFAEPPRLRTPSKSNDIDIDFEGFDINDFKEQSAGKNK